MPRGGRSGAAGKGSGKGAAGDADLAATAAALAAMAVDGGVATSSTGGGAEESSKSRRKKRRARKAAARRAGEGGGPAGSDGGDSDSSADDEAFLATFVGAKGAKDAAPKGVAPPPVAAGAAVGRSEDTQLTGKVGKRRAQVEARRAHRAAGDKVDSLKQIREMTMNGLVSQTQASALAEAAEAESSTKGGASEAKAEDVALSADAKKTFASLMSAGQAAMSAADFSKAVEIWSQASLLAHKMTDQSSACASLANLGVAFKAAGEVRKAINCYARAIPLATGAKSEERQASILFNMANAYQDIGMVAEAHRCAGRARQLRGDKAAPAGSAAAKPPAPPMKVDPRLLDAAIDKARTGDTVALAAVLDASPPPNVVNHQHTATKVTLLHCMCGMGDVGFVTRLLLAGASPALTDKLGFTPLYWAVRFGSSAAVEPLIMYGANVAEELPADKLATLPAPAVEKLVAVLRRLAPGSALAEASSEPKKAAPSSKTGSAAAEFKPDNVSGAAARGELVGRQLEEWGGEQDDADVGALGSSKGAWNQFEANRKLFGVESSFDENLYTTPVPKDKLTDAQKAEAARLADEIMSGSKPMPARAGADEEDLHSAVIRDKHAADASDSFTDAAIAKKAGGSGGKGNRKAGKGKKRSS